MLNEKWVATTDDFVCLFPVLAGALLEQAESLLDRGIHPIKIADGFDLACKKALETLDESAEEFPLNDKDALRELLVETAISSLGSKMYVHLRGLVLQHLLCLAVFLFF